VASIGTGSGRERSSLELQDDFNVLELTLEQRPLVGWAIIAHLSTFFVMGGSFALGMPFVGVPWFFAAVLFFAVGLMWKRKARLRVTRTELQIDAWEGRFARPLRAAVPLDGIELSYGTGGSVNKQTVFHLLVTPSGGEPIRLSALACTREELAQVEQLVEGAGQQAALLAGDAEREVPPELRRIVDAERATRR